MHSVKLRQISEHMVVNIYRHERKRNRLTTRAKQIRNAADMKPPSALDILPMRGIDLRRVGFGNVRDLILGSLECCSSTCEAFVLPASSRVVKKVL